MVLLTRRTPSLVPIPLVKLTPPPCRRAATLLTTLLPERIKFPPEIPPPAPPPTAGSPPAVFPEIVQSDTVSRPQLTPPPLPLVVLSATVDRVSVSQSASIPPPPLPR